MRQFFYLAFMVIVSIFFAGCEKDYPVAGIELHWSDQNGNNIDVNNVVNVPSNGYTTYTLWAENAVNWDDLNLYVTMQVLDLSGGPIGPSEQLENMTRSRTRIPVTFSDIAKGTYKAKITVSGTGLDQTQIYTFTVKIGSGGSPDPDPDPSGGPTIGISKTNPVIGEWIDLSVRTTSGYTDYVYFSASYNNGGSWIAVNSSEYLNASSYFFNGYKFSSSDNGYKYFSQFIKFNKAGSYRLYCQYKNGAISYNEFYVGGGGDDPYTPGEPTDDYVTSAEGFKCYYGNRDVEGSYLNKAIHLNSSTGNGLLEIFTHSSIPAGRAIYVQYSDESDYTFIPKDKSNINYFTLTYGKKGAVRTLKVWMAGYRTLSIKVYYD